MEFRWVAAIALWTVLSGPIFNGKGGLYAPTPERVSANAEKPAATFDTPPGKIRHSLSGEDSAAKRCRTRS
jgi:hypothetical protein